MKKSNLIVAGNEVISLTKAEILKEINLGRLLDVGCGTGLYPQRYCTAISVLEEIASCG